MPTIKDRRAVSWAFGGAMLLALYFILANTFPITPDYQHFYGKIPGEIMRGEVQLYDPNVTFGLLPWIVPPLALISQLPLMYGQTVLTILNGVGLLVAARAFRGHAPDMRYLWWLLPVFTLHSFDLLIRTNLDGLVVLGVALAWIGYRQRNPYLMGAGMWLLTVKPIHVVLFGLLMLWSVRRWPWRDILIMVAPVGVSFILSTVILGPGWIGDYLNYMFLDINDEQIIMPVYLQTSLWRLFEDIGLPAVWGGSVMLVTYGAGVIFVLTRRYATEAMLGIVLGITTVFSTYSMGYHYVVLIPVFVLLLRRHRAYGLIWFLTLTPLLRLYWGFNYVYLDSVYAMTLFGASLYVYLRGASPGAAEKPAETETHLDPA